MQIRLGDKCTFAESVDPARIECVPKMQIRLGDNFTLAESVDPARIKCVLKMQIRLGDKCTLVLCKGCMHTYAPLVNVNHHSLCHFMNTSGAVARPSVRNWYA